MTRRLFWILPLCLFSTAAFAQQFVEQSSSRFPSPNPSDYTNQVTIGDIENDGDLDIIFANGGGFASEGSPEVVRVYANDGAGFFTDVTRESTGNLSGHFRGVEMGDIDNDGDLDMILAQDWNEIPRLLVNNGEGRFSNEEATRLPQISLSSSRAQFGDVDNDGDLDLFITSGTSSRFTCGQYRLYLNDGAGFFSDATSAQFPTGAVCNNMDCIFGDIDNDFDLDIRTASTGSNNSRLYRNDGTGSFTQISAPTDSTCYSYDFGDIDGDGDLDLLGANGSPGSSLDILLENDGSGSYSNVTSQISPNPNFDDNDSKFLDYDNDGDLDLLIARLGSGGERLYANDGAGNFAQTSGVMQVISDSTLDIMVADLTGNGALDIVTGQGESGSFLNRIYVNNGPADTIAPRVIDTEQHPDTDQPGPYVIRALILDDMSSDRNFFDSGIFVNYSVDGGGVLSVPMRHSGGQVYRGAIPGQPGEVLIEYYITATDFAGNTRTGDTLSFDASGGTVASMPLAEDVLLTGCAVDDDCPDDSRCVPVLATCYIPKNRYVSIEPNPANGGTPTARRVSIPGDPDPVVLGWMDAPVEVEVSGPETNPQYLSRLVSVPVYQDWSLLTAGPVHLGDCQVSPGQTYLVQAVSQGQDIGSESSYSVPLSLGTVATWGDVTGSSDLPNGVANFEDIQAVVFGFQQSQQVPALYLDLEGNGNPDNIPDYTVINFVDISRAVQGFQGAMYPFSAPSACPVP